MSGLPDPHSLTVLSLPEFYKKVTLVAEQNKKIDASLVYELRHFPGCYRNGEGKLFDFRERPRVCYSWLRANFSGKELKKVLLKGLEKQVVN